MNDRTRCVLEGYQLIPSMAGVRCGNCVEFIWSRHENDLRRCGCGGCWVDGGLTSLKYGGDFEPKVEQYDILINVETGHVSLLPPDRGV